MDIDAKDILYIVINEIGKQKIRVDVAADIKSSEKYCREILAACATRLGPEASDETLATLSEALLHFMLTISLLPSERKVSILDAELDLVIPSTRELAKSPEKSLVIQMIQGDVAAKAKLAESVQPYRENIWLVSTRPLQTDHRNYCLCPEGSYPRIISDIDAFLVEKGNRGLKLLP